MHLAPRFRRTFHAPGPGLVATALALGLVLATLAADAWAQRRGRAPQPPTQAIRVIVPESLDSAGVLRQLTPEFVRRYRISVRFIPANLAAALKLAEDGKADILILDDHPAAVRFVKAKAGLKRHDVMYADLLIVGPANDPAGIAGMTSVITALQAISRSESPFISRGDGSATYLVERRVWTEIGIMPKPADNAWYTETGADMRTTLGLAAAKGAYTLTDTATWLRFRARKKLVVMVDHDPRLMLRYSVSVVNPEAGGTVNTKAGAAFVTWITSKDIQEKIGKFTINNRAPFSPHYGLKR